MLEEMIDLLFAGKTASRDLTYQELRTVAAFKELFAEVMRERYIELLFCAAEHRKEVARLRESIGMSEFADAFDAEVRHPLAHS